jgi:hypothetical protein
MSTTIFLALNGLGVVFLLYVLANFWKEGHRPLNEKRGDVMEFRGRNWSDVVVVTHPISLSAQCGVSVIPFQARKLGTSGDATHKVA